MASNEVHVGDTPVLRVTFYDENAAVVDLTSFGTLELHVLEPDGVTQHTWTLTSASPTTGIAEYQVVSTDFDTSGDWQFQAYIDDGGGNEFHSDITVRKIYANLF